MNSILPSGECGCRHGRLLESNCSICKSYAKARLAAGQHKVHCSHRRQKCRASMQDPDLYYQEVEEVPSKAPSKQAQPGHQNILTRASGAAKVAGRSILAAPRESWDSVKATAGAALDLMVSPVDEVQIDAVEAESLAREGSGNAPVGEGPVTRARERWREARNDMPKGTWGRIQWLWDQPQVKKLRITITAAQWSFRIPAILALFATQGSLIVSQLSLPLLAPLGVGFTMVIWKNASLIFPRICFLAVFLYVLWFLNSVVQNTVLYLRRQGAVDARVSGAIITASECAALITAMVIVLSMVGVNVNALLLPAGIAVAYAAKDLSHNFLAGFFLFVVQPFKLGDRISVSYSTAAPSSGGRSSWFEGTCEKVDLRYTVVKSGSRRLYVPNSAFITREFVVMEDSEGSKSPSKRDLFPASEMASDLEQPLSAADFPPVPEQSSSSWPQATPRYPWRQPDFDAPIEAQGTDGPPPNAIEEQPMNPRGPGWSPSRQWRGNGWRYQPNPQELQQFNEQQRAQQQNMYTTPVDPNLEASAQSTAGHWDHRGSRASYQQQFPEKRSFNAPGPDGESRPADTRNTAQRQSDQANIVPRREGFPNQERGSQHAVPSHSKES